MNLVEKLKNLELKKLVREIKEVSQIAILASVSLMGIECGRCTFIHHLPEASIEISDYLLKRDPMKIDYSAYKGHAPSWLYEKRLK